mmetsp:Transcript_59123/g.125642  ORF Transcript_59123/g.125642 Transcript_59123/m.125642 type:complete len:907 (+) Transcript_59123:304-3024(+)
MAMNRAVRSRVPLGSRNVNVENGNNGNGNKRDSARSLLERQKSSSSSAVSTAPGSLAGSLAGSEHTTASTGVTSGISANTENRAFASLSSEALRRAIHSASSMANGQNGNGDGGGRDDSTAADAGGKTKQPSGAPRQPLGQSRMQNRQNAEAHARSVPAKKQSEKLSSNEPVTIVEHRKRPCGDGHTVHKYLRGKLLGKGGFAKVYKVTSLDTNKEYAVKIVPKANLVKSRARQKLQTEIKIHRTMKHANICEYKHFFEDKVNCYILLELCHNQSMNEMIKRRKCLTEEETRLLMLQIVDAVSFMHDCNVIHRDLKLGNLFLSKTMNVKVGDFGLACRVDSTDEKRKTICGTPNYIAPEVIEGNKEKRGHSFEVDVWSLGVICFTMLVGKPPYESKDVKSTYRRILANEYSFPTGKVGDDARLLISSMLQTDPKMRPSLDEVRSHSFFTMHQIPGSLPSSCTISAPIWATDEFGELNAIKPTSALDVHFKSGAATSSKQQLPIGTRAAAASGGNAGLRRMDNGVLSKSAGVSKPNMKKPTAKSSAAGAFNIYDDVNDQVECKLDSQSNALIGADADVKPVNKLTERMAACGLDDEVRDMPPPGSNSLPAPQAAAPVVERTEQKQTTPPPPQDAAIAPAKPQSAQSSSSAASEDLQELVMMHSRLEECLENYERIQNGGAKVDCPLKGGEVWGANRWVTRYVDYTSKYGLGFLLNDGSSGVYFNDSTKAVHSATADNFVYVERRKNSAGGVREPVSVYTLTNYPEETLKKKVTLLQHFRSYLLEQQKRAEEAGEAEPLSSNFEERRDASSDDDDSSNLSPMVFMKKWIKTKHAMLFRLSNGTVQVLFYDMTEVLISSEGNLITYVDKEKNRFVHSISEIANKQHGDVSRRLKYAKEILSQLISASKR